MTSRLLRGLGAFALAAGCAVAAPAAAAQATTVAARATAAPVPPRAAPGPASGHDAAGDGSPSGDRRTAADLSITLSGTTLAAGVTGKVADVTLTNRGPEIATAVRVVLRSTGLDPTRVRAGFVDPDPDACDLEADRGVVSCSVIDLEPGQSLDIGVRLTRTPGGAPGDAGALSVSVSHRGTDPESANNRATAWVTVDGTGPDLFAYAPDVPFDPQTNRTAGRVAPGGTARLYFVIGNQGDVAAEGVRVTVTLPRLVTFAGDEPGCAYDADRSVATCTYESLPLAAGGGADPAGDAVSARLFYHDVAVDARAAAPALTGGVVAAEPLGATTRSSARRAPAAPRNMLAVPASLDIDLSDPDPADNADEFAVYVGAAGGAGAGLPITGGRTAVLGATGATLLVAGSALMMLTTRRRRFRPSTAAEEPTG